MADHSKVSWSQGMFLLPHQFQQESRYVERQIDARVRATVPHAWGFFDVAIDEAALALGRVALLRASGVLPDGTTFAIPDHDEQPPSFDVPIDTKSEVVYLGVPIARSGVTQVRAAGDETQGMHRWRAITRTLRDETNASDEPEPVQTAELELRLLRQRDVTDAFAVIGIARVLECRSDRQVLLDRDYIPPQVRIDASDQLSAHASLLHGLVRQRARALAGRMGQLSHGVSEMADFLMLQALNRMEPVFRQHALAPIAHPLTLFADCLQLAGDLSTFTNETRVPIDFPLYRHDDPALAFLPVVAELRRMLSTVLDWTAQQLELIERSHGVRVAILADPELAKSSKFVLAVNAQMPAEHLRVRFPAQSKLGPPDRLRDLVNLALPGIALRSLPTAPRQLPFHAGFHYFELDRGGELWKQLVTSGGLALHVAGDFPGLELELWAIRN
jgi:type VI secretion system protein ImpJ